MKKLLLTIALITAAVCANAQYQVITLGNPISTSAGTTYTLPPALVTNFVTGTGGIDCRKQDYVSLMATCISSNATVSNVTFRFAYSVDALTYGSVGTENELLWIVKGGKTSVTNLQTKGAGYIRFLSVSNDAASDAALTNLVLKYAIKIL